MESVVVFDLGGVLARISHYWQECIEIVGTTSKLDPNARTGLLEAPQFEAFQAGEIALNEYLDSIAEFVGCPREKALAVHNAILQREYDGVGELIEELLAKGVRTGCLSNTNAPHWDAFLSDPRFSWIAKVPYKMASHLVGLNKPDHAIFRLWCSTYGVEPQQVVYFEDGAPNVEGALAVGYRAHRIDPNQETVPQIRGFLVSEGVL